MRKIFSVFIAICILLTLLPATSAYANGDTYNVTAVSSTDRIIDVTAGPGWWANAASHSLVLTENGDLWSFGGNSYGELGIGITSFTESNPVKITTISNVKMIDAGHRFSIAVTNNNELWGWGQNDRNILSQDDTPYYANPIKLSDDVIEAAAGEHNILVLKSNGELYAQGYWGHDSDIDEDRILSSLTKVASNIKAIDSGYYHSIAVSNSGEVYIFGAYVLGSTGRSFGTYNQNTFTMEKINGLSDIRKVFCGENHSFVITNSNELWGWGNNSSGQLGNSVESPWGTFVNPCEIMNDVKDACGGYYHSLFIKTNGDLYAAGRGFEGQLGIENPDANYAVPQYVMNNVMAISAGERHSLAVKTDGDMYAWGNNDIGQLGAGTDYTKVFEPVRIFDYEQGGQLPVDVPRIINRSHTPGMTDASIYGSIEITFDRRLAGTFAVKLWNDTVELHYDIISSIDKSFELIPITKLAPYTEYTIEIEPNQLYDLNDSTKRFPGETWSFTTGGDYSIIVIPGIMGSRLYSNQADYSSSSIVWEPQVDGLGILEQISVLDGLGNKLLNDQLYVRPCEDQNNLGAGTVAQYGREYGALNAYKEIIDALCDRYENRKIYFFSYDWRLDCSINADRLASFIHQIPGNVDIVAHSMGGLVASSYFSKYPNDNKIHRIITCGTPYEGAPVLINTVQNWDVLEAGSILNISDFALGFFGGLTKTVKSSFTSVAELTPTENYVSEQPMFVQPHTPLNQLNYKAYCRSIFGINRFDEAVEFQRSLNSTYGFNKLLDFDRSYFILGINQKTVSAVFFKSSGNDINGLSYETEGDGTVPYLSSSIMKHIENLDQERWVRYDTDHGGTIGQTSEEMKFEKSINAIISCFDKGELPDDGDPFTNGNYIGMKIFCPVDVTITQNGEVLSSALGSFNTSTSFGRLDLVGENNDVKFLCLDDGDYSVTFDGTGTGVMDYTIQFFSSDNTLNDERTFENVPIFPNTTITTGTDETRATVLNVDVDGNGMVDSTWTVSQNGTTSQSDQEKLSNSQPVTCTLFFNTNGGRKINSITAFAGTTVDLFNYIPTREGYEFAGWYADEELTSKITSVTLVNNTTVFAKWIAMTSMDNFTVDYTYKGYLDVDESKWFGIENEGVVRDATQLGLMEGDGDAYFRPETAVKLSEVIKLAAIVHSVYSGNGFVFDQTKGDFWWETYVSYAIENNIINANDFLDFTLNASRAEMAYVLSNALPEIELPAISDQTPSDVSLEDEYGSEILLLYSAGVVRGKDGGVFDGNSDVTRAETAAIVTRLVLIDKRVR